MYGLEISSIGSEYFETCVKWYIKFLKVSSKLQGIFDGYVFTLNEISCDVHFTYLFHVSGHLDQFEGPFFGTTWITWDGWNLTWPPLEDSETNWKTEKWNISVPTDWIFTKCET